MLTNMSVLIFISPFNPSTSLLPYSTPFVYPSYHSPSQCPSYLFLRLRFFNYSLWLILFLWFYLLYYSFSLFTLCSSYLLPYSLFLIFSSFLLLPSAFFLNYSFILYTFSFFLLFFPSSHFFLSFSFILVPVLHDFFYSM